MTVKELIDILKDMPSDADVYHIETIDGGTARDVFDCDKCLQTG